jgi:heme exporter protein D
MPWYVWLIIVLTLGSVIGSLLALRNSKKIPLTEEQLKRIHERNAKLDAQEKRDN